MIEQEIAKIIIKAFEKGNKLLICGNGGSAAQAQHMAAELVGYFSRDRKGLPAIALTTDTSILTSIANDWDFDYVFERQIEALGKKGDILLTISTSGKSQNLLIAQEQAKKQGLIVIDLPRELSKEGQERSNKTPIIQENQLKMIHRICEVIDKRFAFQFI